MSEASGHPIGNGQSINDCTSKAMKSRDHMQSNIFMRGFRKPRENRSRWYILFAAAVLIISLIVVAITLAIHFGTSSNDDKFNEGQVETFHLGPSSKGSTVQPTTRGQILTKLTSNYPSTSNEATSSGSSPFVPTTISSTEVHSNKQTTKVVSRQPSVSEQTTGTVTTGSKTKTDYTTTDQKETSQTQTTSTSSRTSTASASSDQTSQTTKSVSQGTTETVTEYPLRPTLSVQSNDIDLPYSNSILTIKCVTMYARNWQEMSISHELEDTKSTTLVVVSWNLGSPSVNINSNFTSEVSYKEDALLLTIHSKEVDCSYLGRYTCRLALPGGNYQNTTAVKAVNKKDSKPKLTVSTSVVENNAATIKCSMELNEPNVTIAYKFRPPGLDKYFNLSLSPNITRTWTGCSLQIESTLTMVSKMHDNGSVFMCEVTSYHNNVIKTYTAEAEFHVIPKTYCDDKNTYALYPHPYESCNGVIYCYVGGPRVYKINCGAGYCYDTAKTNCVKMDNTSDGVSSVSTETTTTGAKTTKSTTESGSI